MILISPYDAICAGGKCKLTDDVGRLLYTDEIHLSIYGAALIVPPVLDAIEAQGGEMVGATGIEPVTPTMSR